MIATAPAPERDLVTLANTAVPLSDLVAPANATDHLADPNRMDR